MSKNEFFQELREAIKVLPSRKSPKRQAVEETLDEIEDALKRGVSMEELAQIFRTKGYDMAVSTFRQHVREARQARAKAQDEAAKASSVPPKSGDKRVNQRRNAEPVAAVTDGNSQPSAGEAPVEAESDKSVPESDQQLPFDRNQSAA